MQIRFAFMGFRHMHILELYHHIEHSPNTQIVAACEEDAAAVGTLCDGIAITHDHYARMLDDVACDVVAVGDYYGRRGSILIEALRRGKHVISDKPICTTMDELDEIERLAQQNGLCVGCQLNMVYSQNLIVVKRLIGDGRLGDLHQIHIGGQHPLSYGTRPMWYFEPDKHGGTFNDIAIHAVHALPWLTGLELNEIVAARAWNAFATDQPHFRDSAQAMITLTNGCGLMIDVSYALPASHGYGLPQYWRISLFGSGGMAEMSHAMDHVLFAEEGKNDLQKLSGEEGDEDNYLSDFLAELEGNGRRPMTTAQIISATRKSLMIQHAADTGLRDVKL